jgi:hypothetical protein
MPCFLRHSQRRDGVLKGLLENFAQSWCSITPLGDFDSDIGGDLVLWDFKLVIHFLAGSTMLIPSALLYHSNTPIQPGETHYSIVQYAAGGAFSMGAWWAYV